jgi:hypothetical protein
LELAKCNSRLRQKSRTMVAGESRVEGLSGSNMKSTLIEKEMKQLEKIKFKQVLPSPLSKKKSSRLSSTR